MSHHICPMSCHLLTLLQVACASPHFNSLWGRRLPAEITLRCVDIAACSKNPSKREVTVTSVLLWDAAFPVCGQAWTDIRGRRRERIAELGKKYGVLLMLAGSKADGQSQMDALGWQVSHNSYRSGCWLPSPVNCVAWSALALSFFFFFLQIFPSLGSSGWLITSQPVGCSTGSLKMAEKLSARWREKADDGRGALREGDTGGLLISGSLPMQWMWLGRAPVGISWSYCGSSGPGGFCYWSGADAGWPLLFLQVLLPSPNNLTFFFF